MWLKKLLKNIINRQKSKQLLKRKTKSSFFLYLYTMDIEDLIENGDSEELGKIINRYFNNDGELFLKYITDEKIINDDTINNTVYDLFPKNYIEFWFKKNQKITLDYLIDKHFDDIKYENEKYYMEIGSLSDLSFLFYSDLKNFAESILNYDYDPNYFNFSDFGTTVKDLINDLNKKNISSLLGLLKKELNNVIDYNVNNSDSEEIDQFVIEDGNNNSFILTQDRFDTIISDNETIASLIKNSFEDILYSLQDSYSNAYSEAERDAYYTKTISELESFFATDNLGYFSTKEGYSFDKDGKKIPKQNEIYLVNVTNIIKDFILETFRDRMSDFDEYNDMDNFGSFESLLKEYYEGNIRVYYDYVSPNYRDMESLFNEYFSDNI